MERWRRTPDGRPGTLLTALPVVAGVAALMLGLTAAANAPTRAAAPPAAAPQAAAPQAAAPQAAAARVAALHARAVPAAADASHGQQAGRAPAPVPRGKPGPPGFWYGTDSFPVAVSGSAPYPEPQIGGKYGGYIGMTGNWATWQHCGDKVAWSATNAADADTNFSTYHLGIGTGVYWFMGGPGVDPHYDGSTTEAFAWGQQQAIRALSDVAKLTVTYPVIFDDVEIPGKAPGISPAPDNGWNSVYTSPCSGKVSKTGIPPSVDRADFNGFFDYIAHNSSFTPGVYSSAPVWRSIFGTGGYSHIPRTYEWTYLADTSRLSPAPDGWCLRNTTTCAQFFGGVTSSDTNAVMWQWSGGGGTFNGFGDFDQIDANRTPVPAP